MKISARIAWSAVVVAVVLAVLLRRFGEPSNPVLAVLLVVTCLSIGLMLGGDSSDDSAQTPGEGRGESQGGGEGQVGGGGQGEERT